MTKKPTARDMFYQSHRKLALANDTFLVLVQGGLTRECLKRLIAKRPEVWRRFEIWLDKLPEEKGQENGN